MLIRWADIIVLNSGQDGILDQGSFNLDWEYSSKPFSYTEKMLIKHDPARRFRPIATKHLKVSDGVVELMSVLTKAKNNIAVHLIREGYIKEGTDWVLTDKGRLMKEVGGHNSFKKFRKREINQIRNQGIINRLLILATFLSAISPWGIAKWYPSRPIIISQPVIHDTLRVKAVGMVTPQKIQPSNQNGKAK